MTKNKHLIVLIGYNNHTHIITSLVTALKSGADVILIENNSEHSQAIQQSVKAVMCEEKRLIEFWCFQENITNNAVNAFLHYHISKIEEYDYVTFSDADLSLYNPITTFNEIFSILDNPEVGVCCIDLLTDNFPSHIQGSQNWLAQPTDVNEYYSECRTGIHLMTVKKQNLHLLLSGVHFKDSDLANFFNKNGLKWVKTLHNKAYHLTWDLYTEGNPYFEQKRAQSENELWYHTRNSPCMIYKRGIHKRISLN